MNTAYMYMYMYIVLHVYTNAGLILHTWRGKAIFPWQRAPLWGICKFLLGLLKGHQGKDQGQRRQLPPLPPLNIRPANVHVRFASGTTCYVYVEIYRHSCSVQSLFATRYTTLFVAVMKFLKCCWVNILYIRYEWNVRLYQKVFSIIHCTHCTCTCRSTWSSIWNMDSMAASKWNLIFCSRGRERKKKISPKKKFRMKN